jgi:2-acylglycerol O-acyltransferase 2
MPPPASLHEEAVFPERLDHPSKSFAQVTSEPPAESNGLPNGSPEHSAIKYNAVQSPGEYVGAGILDAPVSPARGHKRLGSRGSRGSLNGVKSPKKQLSIGSENSDNVVYEKHSDGNGGQLTSVKPTEDYEKNLKQGQREEKLNANGASATKGEQELELTSGRVASAGWERSGHVY